MSKGILPASTNYLDLPPFSPVFLSFLNLSILLLVLSTSLLPISGSAALFLGSWDSMFAPVLPTDSPEIFPSMFKWYYPGLEVYKGRYFFALDSHLSDSDSCSSYFYSRIHTLTKRSLSHFYLPTLYSLSVPVPVDSK